MSKKNTGIAKSTRFEDALGELEALVEKLEDGDQSLEESLHQFERGMALSKFCQQSLSQAEQKIKILTNTEIPVDEEDRSAGLQDFNP